MPNPGTANNGLGINSFSGPMGQKEPAYGAVERMKILTAIAPPGTNPAVNAPTRSKKAAQRGKKAEIDPRQVMSPANAQMPQGVPYDQQVAEFWAQLAAEPGASTTIQRIASEVAG